MAQRLSINEARTLPLTGDTELFIQVPMVGVEPSVGITPGKASIKEMREYFSGGSGVGQQIQTFTTPATLPAANMIAAPIASTAIGSYFTLPFTSVGKELVAGDSNFYGAIGDNIQVTRTGWYRITMEISYHYAQDSATSTYRFRPIVRTIYTGGQVSLANGYYIRPVNAGTFVAGEFGLVHDIVQLTANAQIAVSTAVQNVGTGGWGGSTDSSLQCGTTSNGYHTHLHIELIRIV